MDFELVAKIYLSESGKERIYKTIDTLCDIEDGLYKTGVASESAKQITKTREILKELIETGIIED